MFFYYLDLGWRSIKRTPALSVLMVLAISVGIGITITTLNVYKMSTVNPAEKRSDQLFSVRLKSQGMDGWEDINNQITYQDAINLGASGVPTRQSPMFTTGAAVQIENPDFKAILERVRVAESRIFELFSISFLYGHAWDNSVDKDPSYQAVISEHLNQTLFNGENSIGNILYLNRKPYQIVGVIKEWSPSPKYYDLNTGPFAKSEHIFVPFSLAPIEEFEPWGNTQGWKREKVDTYEQRLASEYHWLQYWVELNTDDQKQSYLQWLEHYVEQQKLIGRFEQADAHGDISDVAEWLDINKVVSEDNKIILGLSVLFLLVCLVNMLGLLLTKFLKRAPEVGVRRAIGASRAHIFSQHIIEVGLTGVFGGLLGLLWAWISLSLLSSHFELEESLTQFNFTMWLAAPTIALIASFLAGVYPAWRICATNPSLYLKSQ